MIKYQKLSSSAKVPLLATPESAGFDLFSDSDTIVPAQGKSLIATSISLQLPSDCFARISPRSGLAWKNFIDVGAGIIDSDYRGEIKVLLFNFSQQDFTVNKGDRIAQLIIQKVERPTFIELNLDSTERGAGGFGSTGKN